MGTVYFVTLEVMVSTCSHPKKIVKACDSFEKAVNYINSQVDRSQQILSIDYAERYENYTVELHDGIDRVFYSVTTMPVE